MSFILIPLILCPGATIMSNNSPGRLCNNAAALTRLERSQCRIVFVVDIGADYSIN